MSVSAIKTTPIKTRIFHRGENLADFIIESIPNASWKEGVILVVTSKLVSLEENRVVSKSLTKKSELIKQEAEHVLGEMGFGSILTIKQGLLLASAGVDESNSPEDDYLLLPADPYQSATRLRRELINRLQLKKFGLIITDSKTNPLRLGVVGVALSFAGFKPVVSLVGQRDLFDRPLKMTKINIVDGLAAGAVLSMGEANECQPLALIEYNGITFEDESSKVDLLINKEDDMYFSLYQHLLK